MGGRVASPTFGGRVEELQVLEAARGRAADAEPAVVLVGGEAGVGKTRLVEELAVRCAAEGMRVLSGGCVPVAAGALPYAPIVEALRPLPDELGADAVRRLAGPSWAELARLLPGLGAPPGGLPGQAAQTRLFELLLGLLGRLGEQAAVCLAVEDLHWADRSTRDLLIFLARNLRHERLLLVATHRSDEPGTEWLPSYLAELDRGGRTRRLELPRLDRAGTAAQLVGILGAAPPAELVEAVFARSEGNPFFTEELLATVRAGSGTRSPRPPVTTSATWSCGNGSRSARGQGTLTGWTCWVGRRRWPRSAEPPTMPSGCSNRPSIRWTGRWSRSGPRCCSAAWASTASAPGPRRPPLPPTRRRSGSWPERHPRPCGPGCSRATAWC